MKRKAALQLLKWKLESASPLVIYGARQVGKSYSVREFGKDKTQYANFVEINFEQMPSAVSIFQGDLLPAKIIKNLEDLTGKKIEQKKTLLFFDEIQLCPSALTSLKYFEDEISQGVSHYHIIAAGSLLGVTSKLNVYDDKGNLTAGSRAGDKYQHPVGKTEPLMMYPMDFEEFLWANGETYLANLIRECFKDNRRLPDVSHLHALTLCKAFLIVGGMPKVVEAYVDRKDFRKIQNLIINDYKLDVSKYVRSVVDKQKVSDTYASIPAQLGVPKQSKRFIYAGVKENGTGKKYRGSVDWLTQAKIIIQCRQAENGDRPLPSEKNSSYKLYLNDTGLLCHQLKINFQNFEEFDKKYLGVVSENYAACALQGKIQSLGEVLHYWRYINDHSNADAEVDFLITTDMGNVPIEVKSGKNTQSKSLGVFMDKYSPNLSYRISEKNLGYDPDKRLKSIPLYAVFCIEDMILT